MLIAVLLNLGYLALMAIVGYVLSSDAFAEAAGELNTPEAREPVVRLILLIGIGGGSALALFTGVFASVGAIGNEIERGTILAVVARPVSRWEIVIGKFLGNGLLALLYLVIQGLGIGLVMAALSGVWVTDFLVALALLGIQVLVMVAVAVAGSTRLSMVANAVAVIVLYLALTNTALLFLLGELADSDLLRGAADWSRLALPVGPVSDLAGVVLLGPVARMLGQAAGADSPLPTRDWIWIYALVYLVVVLVLASISLSRRDLR